MPTRKPSSTPVETGTRRPSVATAVEAIAIVFQALDPAAQDEALVRLAEARASRGAQDDSEMARHLRSLARVRQVVGHPPTVGEYKDVSARLIAAGEDVETFSRLYRYFNYSWPRATEAQALAETTTAQRIDARFRFRQVGKVWRFTEDALRDALAQATAHYGRPPLVAEYDWWRRRELEKAKATGNLGLHLPSASPFRRRWGSWEAALLTLGYTPDQVAERLS